MLKSEAIAELLRRGNERDEEDPFVIVPQPDLEKLEEKGASTIDLCLGTWFLTLRQASVPCLRVGDRVSEARLAKKPSRNSCKSSNADISHSSVQRHALTHSMQQGQGNPSPGQGQGAGE